MKRWPIRWLLLGVAGASLLLPLMFVISLRRFDAILVRQTERELNAQGALVAALYQGIWAELNGERFGNPRDPVHLDNSYTPFHPQLTRLTEVADPVPEALPSRKPLAQRAQRHFEALTRILKTAQVFNLSGIRVLDAEGCTVASTRALGECYSGLPEVKAALAGHQSAVLRQRISDEPPPALASLSRRGELRVFVALPVHNDGHRIGAVLLSRTAESGLEWLFKQRRDLFFSGLVVLIGVVLLGVGFSRLITRPLSEMTKRLAAGGEGSDLKLRELPAPPEIHTLGVALDQRAAALESRGRYIEEFAANLSHELKTPLTSIRGAVELLLGSSDGMSEQQRRRFLENIDAAAARTDRLVTRLLQLARLEVQHEEQDSVVLSDWIDQLAQRFGDAVTVERRGELSVKFGLSALESVVTNLVDNALRYRRAQPVKLSFEIRPARTDAAKPGPGTSSSEERRLVIDVEDDGLGISQDNQRRLFERFFTTERDSGGTGLGLPIVLATARAHGGEVEVQSGDTGTRVSVWMTCVSTEPKAVMSAKKND